VKNIWIEIVKIWKESVETLVSPKKYFSAIPKEGGLKEPVIKALVYGAVAAILNTLVGFAQLPELGQIFFIIFMLIMFPLFNVAILFVEAGVYLVISAVCGGSADYKLNLRNAASLMAVMPLVFIAIIAYAVSNSPAAAIVVIEILGIYGTVLFYFAFTEGLGAKKTPIKIIVTFMILLSLLISTSAILASKNIKPVVPNMFTIPAETQKTI
jgi:hypothetical protein